jgi:hypothetical protein
LLLTFASIIVPGFSLFEIHDQDFYFLLDMYVLEHVTSSSTKESEVLYD